MIDTNLYRARIGCFNHKLRKMKFMNKIDYYKQFNSEKSNAGENSFKSIQILFKIVAIFCLLSGGVPCTTPPSLCRSRTCTVGWGSRSGQGAGQGSWFLPLRRLVILGEY